MTTPGLKVSYPSDAEAHFEEIQKKLAARREGVTPHCAAGYCGPWIENNWISHFEGLWNKEKAKGTKLSAIFGPYIPLFFPWVDSWVNSGYHYPAGFAEEVKAMLRPDVPYITVSQNDEGLTGKCEILMSSIPNVVVLSGGGYGHVAIPLIKQEEPLNNAKPMARRWNLISYMGDLSHSPENMRSLMADKVTAQSSLLRINAKVGQGSDWKQVMADSRASLCPRGFGRTSYRLVETLQMGLIPVYVYTDVPWVPYPDLSKDLLFVTKVDGLQDVVKNLNDMKPSKLNEMERRIVGLRQSHFTVSGAMEQIGRFMKDGGGDLRCEVLPPTVRGAGSC